MAGLMFDTATRVPLPSILRPEKLDDILGQNHLIGPGKSLRKLVESKRLSSLIIWGPAGTGKTTLARVIAKTSGFKFKPLNATDASVKDIRSEGDMAKKSGQTTVMFVDEIHRFSKTQQDVLLPLVEDGILILIGATTENPYMSVNNPLISRSHIFEVRQLTKTDLVRIFMKGVAYYRKIGQNITATEEAVLRTVVLSCGDARKVLMILELAVMTLPDDSLEINLDLINLVAPNKYNILGDTEHYDLASAYQGSIQASDPHSAVFWLAKWLESGEDPRYIARRLLVSAAEDAFSSPQCLIAANAAYTAAAEVGRPECDIVLSAATIMVALAPRDKSAAKAIWAAVKDVRDNLDIVVPDKMRDCHYQGAKKMGHGEYKDGINQHAYVGVNKVYYEPPLPPPEEG